MNINFKHPKYIIPLIILPFICIFFYIYKELFKESTTSTPEQQSLQEKIVDVSEEVKNQALADKLQAYKNQYRQGDGYTAIGRLQEERNEEYSFENFYNEKEKRQLDSLEKELKKQQFISHTKTPEKHYQDKDPRELNMALSKLTKNEFEDYPAKNSVVIPQEDPMELFRKQMMFADSFAKANDPTYQQQLKNLEIKKQAQRKEDNRMKLAVRRYNQINPFFNTLNRIEENSLIKAIIDENRTVYADSRLRIRILEDLLIAGNYIEKGTYLYAKISGFSSQRVKLTISSIMFKGKILPIELNIYDLDGQEGLYVPESAFRELSRDLAGSTTQGININSAMENNNQLFMSTLQRMFQSSSSALSKYIRRNRAHIKYNSLVYLLDSSELTHSQ